MKKTIIVIVAAFCVTNKAVSQSAWPVLETLEMTKTEFNPVVGLKNKRSLFLATNDTSRVIIDSLGGMRIRALGIDYPVPADEPELYRALYADKFGNIVTSDMTGGKAANPCLRSLQPPSKACVPAAVSWFEGGNSLGSCGSSLIGPCSNNDFILQANAKKILLLTTTGRIAAGENNAVTTTAIMDISSPAVTNPNTGTRDHLRIYGDYDGTIEATGSMNLYAVDNFNLNIGSPGSSNAMLYADASGVSALGSFYVAGATTLNGAATMNGNAVVGGKLFAGPQSSSLAKLNVNVTGSSGSPVNAIDVFDSFTNKVNFRVKSNGEVYARFLKVTVNAFPDYVFEKDYRLMSLKEIEAYYLKNKHLPEMPAASEVEKEGMNVGDINVLLVKKIEELTILMVAQQKEIDALKAKSN